MPCVNKVMEPHDKQIKLPAFFLKERNLVNQSDLTKHNRRVNFVTFFPLKKHTHFHQTPCSNGVRLHPV